MKANDLREIDFSRFQETFDWTDEQMLVWTLKCGSAMTIKEFSKAITDTMSERLIKEIGEEI